MRDEPAYLHDALQALEELQEFVNNTQEENFLANPLEQSYVFHRLVIFGEAMARVAPTLSTKYQELPWSAVIALRDRLVHAYFDLDMPLLWQIASTRIEEMIALLRAILKTEFPEERE